MGADKTPRPNSEPYWNRCFVMRAKISRSTRPSAHAPQVTRNASTEPTGRGSAALSDDTLDSAARRLRSATIDVIWRQWAAVGASAASRVRARAVVDPEALVLASLAFVSEEPRLADLLHDWITRNADLLSVQRAKNLTRGFDEPVRALIDDGLRWLARIAIEEGKDLRWRSLLKQRSPSRSAWVTPVVRGNKGRASRARVTDPATLVLRFRLAFAVGVKADLLSYLLCTPDEWATVRTVSAMTGYTPAAVRRAVDDLAAAQFVESHAAHPVRYRIAREQWQPLLRFDEHLAPWRGWRDVFGFATAFLAWHRTAADTHTPYVIGVEARELLERHQAVFERDRIATWGPHTRIQDWVAFTVSGVDALARWMREHA